MRQHRGMRPHDIVILLKIIGLGKKNWLNKELAQQLFISPSEISESLDRSQMAGLIDYNKKVVNRQALLEFLEHGIHYVFPQKPGALVTGIPTAHGHPFMQKLFDAEISYVWPDFQGESRGPSVEPLYPNQVMAIKSDDNLYKSLALVDVIRVGKVREVAAAKKELHKMIMG